MYKYIKLGQYHIVLDLKYGLPLIWEPEIMKVPQTRIKPTTLATNTQTTDLKGLSQL